MAEQYQFAEVEKALTDIKELMRWQHWVKTQVRVGVELEKEGTPREHLLGILNPSHSYDKLGKYNVVNVVHDGSVRGGNEILVCGTNEAFSTAHHKMTELHKLFKRVGLKAGPTCGMHYHLVASQDDDMPEVILKNLYQLVRRYYAGLMYLTSTGTGGPVTRSTDMHFYAPSHLGITPNGRTMAEVKSLLFQRNGRYGAFNMGTFDQDHPAGVPALKNLMRFNADGSVERFHVEFRWPDSTDSPAQIVAQMYLFRALLMKAVELSRFGVMQADSDTEQWTKNKAAVQYMAGGRTHGSDGPDSGFSIGFAREEASKLLTALRSHLLNIDGSSLAVLEEVISKAVWERRREGHSWDRVERNLLPRERQLNEDSEQILRAVLLQQVTGAKSAKDWKTKAAEALGLKRQRVVSAVKRVEHQVQMVFDRAAGTYMVVW